MVAGSEVANVRHLEVAHFRTAFALRHARRRVLAAVLPAVVQQQRRARRKEARCSVRGHATPCPQLNTGRTHLALLELLNARPHI